ncbi:MAG: PD-(D/E)XK nuclease family protein, partial [Halobacteriales archaeon]
VLAALGVDAPERPDRRPLACLGDERASWVRAIASRGREFSTVGEILDQFEDRGGPPQPALRRAVERLGLADAAPEAATVADVAWLAREGPDEADPDGPLVDARVACTIDRDAVYLLGPGPAWVRPGPTAVREAWAARERHRLARVLAPGPERHLRIADDDLEVAGLDELLGGIDARPLDASPTHPTGFGFAPKGRPRSGHDRFTKSQLNRLLSSPRDALFTDLLDAPETAAKRRGTAVHEYAELALAAPAAVEAFDRDDLVETIVESVAELVPQRRRPTIAARVRAATAVVDAYLADVEPPTEPTPGYAPPTWLRNELAERAGVTVAGAATEQYFRDDDLGVSGVVDLIRSPTHLVDFKTGAPPPVGGLVAGARGETEPRSVQLPLYLAALRRRQPDRVLRMTFVYCHAVATAALRAQPWLDALERTIPYRPAPAGAAAVEAIERLGAAVPRGHPRRLAIEAVGAERLAGSLEGIPASDESAVASRVRSHLEGTDLDESTAAAGARSVAIGLADRRARTLFRDDLDAFETEVERWRRRRRRFDRSGYPFGDPPGERLEFPDLHADASPLRSGRGSS